MLVLVLSVASRRHISVSSYCGRMYSISIISNLSMCFNRWLSCVAELFRVVLVVLSNGLHVWTSGSFILQVRVAHSRRNLSMLEVAFGVPLCLLLLLSSLW